MMHKLTPHRTFTWSARSLLVTGPLALLTLAAWGFELVDARPVLVLMVYQLLLLLCVGAGCVAAISGSILAIHAAFAAGFQTGLASVDPSAVQPPPRPGDDPLLRLVE